MDNGKLRAKYIFDDDFEPEYITGAFGSILPSGDLMAAFFLERITIPYKTAQSIEEDGRVLNDLTVIDPDPADYDMRRTIKGGIIMNRTTAISVYKWLKGKLVEMGVDESEL